MRGIGTRTTCPASTTPPDRGKLPKELKSPRWIVVDTRMNAHRHLLLSVLSYVFVLARRGQESNPLAVSGRAGPLQLRQQPPRALETSMARLVLTRSIR